MNPVMSMSMSESESFSEEMKHESKTQHLEQKEQHEHPISVLPIVVDNQFLVAEEKTVTVKKVEEGTRRGNGGSNNVLKNKEKKLNMALLGLRISAFVLCVKSFAVMAANKQLFVTEEAELISQSFVLYKEFKYSFSVSVIACVYSVLQICDLVKYLITKRNTVDPKLRGYFNFAMDQILTYLLMSASSSAATLAYHWEYEWGKQLFSVLANASVALSYLAFVAFALTSLISGYILCKV